MPPPPRGPAACPRSPSGCASLVRGRGPAGTLFFSREEDGTLHMAPSSSLAFPSPGTVSVWLVGGGVRRSGRPPGPPPTPRPPLPHRLQPTAQGPPIRRPTPRVCGVVHLLLPPHPPRGSPPTPPSQDPTATREIRTPPRPPPGTCHLKPPQTPRIGSIPPFGPQAISRRIPSKAFRSPPVLPIFPRSLGGGGSSPSGRTEGHPPRIPSHPVQIPAPVEVDGERFFCTYGGIGRGQPAVAFPPTAFFLAANGQTSTNATTIGPPTNPPMNRFHPSTDQSTPEHKWFPPRVPCFVGLYILVCCSSLAVLPFGIGPFENQGPIKEYQTVATEF